MVEKYPPDIWLPLKKNWDWQLESWDTPQTLNVGEEKLLIQDKDLLSTKGWIWSAGWQADSPNAGVRIEYTGPKGRLYRSIATIQGIHDYGAQSLASPGAWSVTRWAESVAPEYAVVFWSSFSFPFQPKFSFRMINGGVTPITIYKIYMTFLLLWEE